jgi:hypothetical protein
MKSISTVSSLVIFVFGLLAVSAQAAVKTYTAPVGMAISGDYVVKVDNITIPVYRGAGDLPYSFAYFDFSGSAAIHITSVARNLSSVVVRPASKVTPVITGNNIMTFTLTNSPTHLSIEPAGKNGPLLLFANPMEVNPPTAGSSTVKYYGPGLHNRANGKIPANGMITLTSGQTLYIAGGAVVQAGVYASGNNITIKGRGILDGLPWYVGYGPQPSGGNRGQILAENITGTSMGTGLNIEGIILKDAWYTSVGLSRANYISAKNLKIVANRHDATPPPGLPFVNLGRAADGFHTFNTSHLEILDSFIRTDDDCIAPIVSWVATPSDGLIIRRTSLWTDRANIWRIGSGFQGLGVPSPSMRNQEYTDIDVLHYDTFAGDIQNPAIRIQPNKAQPLEHIRFENIRINREGQSALVEIQPYLNTTAPINDVTFKNITVTGNLTNGYGTIIVRSPDAGSPITNVRFENFTRHGPTTFASSPGVTVGSYTSGVTFTGGTTDTIAPSVPANLNGIAVSSSQVNLTWSASTDNVGVTGYKVYRNGALVTSVTGTNYSNTGLAALTTYNFTVASFDAAGNDSAQSAIKAVRTLAGGTTSLPDMVVTNITYSSGRITATVRNQGAAATPAGVGIGVAYKVDGIYRTGTLLSVTLAAGASMNIVGNYVIPTGTHTVLAHVDDVNRFAETNESNNTLSRSIVVP